MNKEKNGEEPLKPLPESTGGRNLFSRLGVSLAEMTLITILRFYRLASLLLSAILLLLFPARFAAGIQFSLFFLVFAASIMMVILYERCWKSDRIMLTLIFFEVAGISLLLAATGGFQGPFLWYALNPFLVTTAFFTFFTAWPLMLLLIVGTFSWKAYIFADTASLAEIFFNNYYSALNLILIVLIINLFARMHMSISERSEAKMSQEQELLAAYQNLTANYEILKGLSDFQQKAVSSRDQKGIYLALVDSLVRLFPLKRAFVAAQAFDHSKASEEGLSLRIIEPGKREHLETSSLIIDELEDNFELLAGIKDKKIYVGADRQWFAVPIMRDQNTVEAAFVGVLRGKINPLSFVDDISLFINFAEQAIAWLFLFRQKEQVLGQISSIYEAVGAAASSSNPYTVTKLFASYAKALTGCDKTLFWIEGTGSPDADDYSPVYSVAGPQEICPEEEWQEQLLSAWNHICKDPRPVVSNIKLSNQTRARLVAVPVKSGGNCIGMLAGVQSNSTHSIKEVIQPLNILGDLGAIAIEKNLVEAFAEKALVIDEQKRIANEIHDTISQNLFSIVYGIDALLREKQVEMSEKCRSNLVDIKTLSAKTGRDLRALIFGLNPKQEKNESFIGEISGYLKQAARMNRVKITHQIRGNNEYLNPAMCKTFYRIMKEATGNAIRHSECTEIKVSLEFTPFNSTLTVSDNGIGFNADNSLDFSANGGRLGLINMRELAIGLKGALNIESIPGEGTTVTCSIPTSPLSMV